MTQLTQADLFRPHRVLVDSELTRKVLQRNLKEARVSLFFLIAFCPTFWSPAKGGCRSRSPLHPEQTCLAHMHTTISSKYKVCFLFFTKEDIAFFKASNLQREAPEGRGKRALIDKTRAEQIAAREALINFNERVCALSSEYTIAPVTEESIKQREVRHSLVPSGQVDLPYPAGTSIVSQDSLEDFAKSLWLFLSAVVSNFGVLTPTYL